MPHHYEAVALRAFLAGRVVDSHVFVPFDIQQGLAGRFALVIDLLQLEVVKPNAPAPALADIDSNTPSQHFHQLSTTRRTFHNLFLPGIRFANDHLSL